MLLQGDTKRWELIGLIEVNLRRLLAASLVGRFGGDAWDKGLNKGQRDIIEDNLWKNQKRRLNDVPDLEERLEHLDMGSLLEAVENHWKTTFCHLFENNRPLFDTQVKILRLMRNALGHFRSEKLPSGADDPTLRPNFDTHAPLFYRNVLRGLAAKELRCVEFSSATGHRNREDPLTLRRRDYVEFVGRDGDLTKISGLLADPTPVVAVLGIGGVGKTALCLETALRLYRAGLFDEVVYVSAKTGFLLAEQAASYPQPLKTLDDLIDQIIAALGGSKAEINPDYSREERAFSLLGNQKTLLIVDNFETIEDKNQTADFLWRVPPGTRVLISSRTPPPSGGRYHYLEELDIEAIQKIIENECALKGKPNLIRTEDPKIMAEVYTAIGGIPLAAKLLVGAMVSKFKGLGSVLSDFRTADRNDLLAFCFGYIYQDSLTEDARHLLRCMAVASEDAKIHELEAASGMRANRLADAIQNLELTSLVVHETSPDGVDLYGLLPLTRLFARGRMLEHPGMEMDVRHRIDEYLRDQEAKGDPALSRSGQEAIRLANIARIRLKSRRLEDALVMAKRALSMDDRVPFVHLVYGMIEEERGNFMEAERILANAHHRFPKEQRITHKLAAVRSRLEKFPEAAALYQEILLPKPVTEQEIVQLEYTLQGMAANLKYWITHLRKAGRYDEVRRQTHAFLNLVDNHLKYPGPLPSKTRAFVKEIRAAYARELSIDGDFAAAEVYLLNSLIEGATDGRDMSHNSAVESALGHNLTRWNPPDAAQRAEKYRNALSKAKRNSGAVSSRA